jgi:hypothetical protein
MTPEPAGILALSQSPLQDRREVWTAISTSGSPNGVARVNLFNFGVQQAPLRRLSRVASDKIQSYTFTWLQRTMCYRDPYLRASSASAPEGPDSNSP